MWLWYGDSLCPSAEYTVPGTCLVSFPGWTAQAALDAEARGDIQALSFYLDGEVRGVVICLGTNDLGAGRTVDDVVADLLALHDVCRSRGVRRIVATYVPDAVFHSEAFNDAYEAQSGVDVDFFDFFLTRTAQDVRPDGLHSSDIGQVRLQAAFRLFMDDAQQDSDWEDVAGVPYSSEDSD